MVDWWTEEWAIGTGQSRVYCGISRTEEGYAVDVFRGDTCIDSFVFNTQHDAKRAADGLRAHYDNSHRGFSFPAAAGVPV